MPELLPPHTESFFWVAAQLAFSLLGVSLWPQLKTIFPGAADRLAVIGRLAHSLVIPYIALLIGSVSARNTGLIGADALPYSSADWTRALLWGAALGGIALAVLIRSRQLPEAPPLQALLDEARWAFYRGAAIGWAGMLLGGVALGAGLAVLEWAALRGIHASLGQAAPLRLSALARLALSAAVFTATQNAWVAGAAGALVALGLARWSAPHD